MITINILRRVKRKLGRILFKNKKKATRSVEKVDIKPASKKTLKQRPRTQGLGIDIGIAKFATFSDGYVVESPMHTYHLNPKSISKDKFASYRDIAHKQALEHILKANPSYVAIESINLTGGNIPPNIKVRAEYLDFDLFFSRLMSLCIKHNIELRRLLKREPSSKRCYKCGKINRGLTLSDRTYVCDCGWKCDRDLNAALNICNRMRYVVIHERTR